MHMAGHAIRIQFHVQHALGDDPAIPRTRQARILDRVLKKEEHARLIAFVTLVDQHRAPFQEIPVPFQRQVDDRIQQWVPGTHNAAAGCPWGATKDFSKAMRSYRRRTGSPIPINRSRFRTGAGTWVIS